MLIVIYARVSKENGELDISKSIENQISVLSKYANNNSHKIYKIYYDDGYSGSAIKIPAIKQLLSDMNKKKFDTLIKSVAQRKSKIL